MMLQWFSKGCIGCSRDLLSDYTLVTMGIARIARGTQRGCAVTTLCSASQHSFCMS